jgi:hypothetical protein
MRVHFGRLAVAVAAFLTSVAMLPQGLAAADTAACTGLNISIADNAGWEGTGPGTTTAHFTVTVTGCAADGVKVSYETIDGTAHSAQPPDKDYDPSSGTLVWQSGDSSSKTISVPISRDDAIETSETFFVQLTWVSGTGVIADEQAVGTIWDDDNPDLPPPPVLVTGPSGGTISWDDGRPYCEITISLSHVVSDPVRVTWQTVDGTAHAGRDFVGVDSGVVTIEPGELSGTAIVRAVPGAVPESGTYFFVELTSTSLGVIDDGWTTVTFTNRG